MRAVVVSLLTVVACGRSAPHDPARDSDKPAAAAGTDDDHCDASKRKVCVGKDIVECKPDGTLGRRLRACHEGCVDGICKASCSADGVELIYLVDTADNFLSFDPRKLPDDPFHLIGKLTCGFGSAGSPFSMSVDRNGVAWVLYSSGQLFKVSIADAKCQNASYTDLGYHLFGMGFVSDAPGAQTEKLYIAAADATNRLGYLDTQTSPPTFHPAGAITATQARNAELTGTGEAKLYGFFPNPDTASFVQEIDRRTGDPRGPKFNLGGPPLGGVSAWAFAQWGGVFYIFVTASDGLGSTVRAIRRSTGDYKVVMENLPYRISGAGVSTCAPELDKSP
jgi:hypothetical protein